MMQEEETNFGISKRKYPLSGTLKTSLISMLSLFIGGIIGIAIFLIKFTLPFCVAVFDSYVQHRPTVVQEMLDFAKNDWKRMITARRDFYGRLIQKDPVKQKFLKAWTNRLNALSKYCQEIEQTPMLS